MTDELKNKIEEQIRAVRKKAREVDEAMERAAEMAKEDSRALFVAAVKEITGRKLTRTKEEILKNGTGEERAALLVVNFEREQQGIPFLTEKDKDRLYPKTKRDETAYKDYLHRYGMFQKVESFVSIAYRMFQVEAANLQRLLTMRRGYEREITARGLLLSQMKRTLKERGGFDEAFIKEIMEDVIKAAPLEGEDFHVVGEGFAMKDYTQEERRVEMDIIEAAQNVKERIADFKGYAAAIDEYLNERGFSRHILPVFIESVINEMEEEAYYDTLKIRKIYRRSRLNKRIAEGEKVEPWEEQDAVAPDYKEVEKNFRKYQKMKKAIS